MYINRFFLGKYNQNVYTLDEFVQIKSRAFLVDSYIRYYHTETI